jgi:hypothetical protein
VPKRMTSTAAIKKKSFSMCMNNVTGIWFIHWIHVGWFIRDGPSNMTSVNPHYRLFLSWRPKQQGEWRVHTDKHQFLLYLSTSKGQYVFSVLQQKFTINYAVVKTQIKRTGCAISAKSESFKTLW